MTESLTHKTMAFKDNTIKTNGQELILEEPLSMRIDGNSYAVVMRTPGDEINHAAGNRIWLAINAHGKRLFKD